MDRRCDRDALDTPVPNALSTLPSWDILRVTRIETKAEAMKTSIASVLGILTACSGVSDVRVFLGNWTSVGQQIAQCDGNSSLNGSVTIAGGPEAGQVTTHTPNGCSLDWTVDANRASLINVMPPTWQGCSPGKPYNGCAQQCLELLDNGRTWP